jgi:hypothetical protein
MEKLIEEEVLVCLEKGFHQNQIALQEKPQKNPFVTKTDPEVGKLIIFYGNNQRKKHANIASVVKSNSNKNHLAIEDTRKRNKVHI